MDGKNNWDICKAFLTEIYLDDIISYSLMYLLTHYLEYW